MNLTAQQFAFVADLVKREAAIVLAPGKEYLVESRLLPLAREANQDTVGGLVNHVQNGGATQWRTRIVEALTTNETSWFRDREPFTALTSVILPEVLSGPVTRPVRIWSAACSSGQEPYSIAIQLEKSLPAGRRYEIVGSDLSSEMVARATAGRFNHLEVNRGLPATELVNYFDRVGTDWQVNQRLRRNVTFRQLNLIGPLPTMAAFDVVFLRNVLIYFDLDTKRQVLRRVQELIRPGGWLLLGAAETTVGIDTSYERVAVGRTAVYRVPSGSRQQSTAVNGTAVKGVTTCSQS